MVKKRYAYTIEHGSSKIQAGFYRDESFSSIAAAVGATEVANTDLVNVIMQADVSDLPLPCINFTYEVAGKKKSSYAYFSSDKTPNAVATALMGTTFNSGTIISISYPDP